MKRVMQVILTIVVLLVPGMLATGSVFQADDHIRAVVRGSSFATSGTAVQLFYGMDKSVKDSFCENSIVPVYRKGLGYYYSKAEVGKIKVTKNLNDRYIEGVVVEGTLRPGDIAMEARSECQLPSSQPTS